MDLEDLHIQLIRHPLFSHLSDENGLRLFMASHAFCVWDFQSLVKALQGALTCVEIPWFPTPDPEARRLVNQIVLDEESDLNYDGASLSHFEMYLKAMRECGSDTQPIENFVASMRRGVPLYRCLEQTSIPVGVGRFVTTTLDIARSGKPHQITAALAYGREEIIPDTFRRLVQSLSGVNSQKWKQFHYYLTRHIEKDGNEHGPMARELVNRLCGGDKRKWREAEQAARAALEARLNLWDGIFSELKTGGKKYSSIMS